jgi:adenylate cyclase
MDALAPSDIFQFDDFRLDRRGLFRREGPNTFVPVKMGSRALDVLRMLVERSGELVLKDELVAAVWSGIVVEDSNLTVQISILRRVLDGAAAEGSCIQTVAGRGYRFVAQVRRGAIEPESEIGFGGMAWQAWISSGAVPRVQMPTGAAVLDPSEVKSTPHLSIVVLPFRNLSNDPEQQYFVDGVTEDLTTDLSRIDGSFVISRNTAFSYKDKPSDAKQIGRELGVRYVLEGSIQRSDNRVRVNTQLIDAETAAHLWADRFDGDTSDLFTLQDEVTSRIAVTLGLELVRAEAARPTQHPDAFDYILRGRAVSTKPRSRDNFAERIELFERALALDPASIEAQSRLATALAARVMNNMTDTAAADMARADALATQALAALPHSTLAHHVRGLVLRAQRRFAEAIPEYEAALASDRNWVIALYALGQCKAMTGSIEETIPLVERAIRVSPRDPLLGSFCSEIGRAHLLQSRTDEAIPWLERARNTTPAHPSFRAWLASAYALKGETERAAVELAEARKLGSDHRFSSIVGVKEWYWTPAISALLETTFLAGLRKAGMPEQ